MKNSSNTLHGLHFAVIGAGPAGLTFAKAACDQGASVEILEKAGDPRGKDAGYTDRSFNLTLNTVGRKVLGDPRIWTGSINLTGRAVHNPEDGSIMKYGSFGEDDAAILTSIPRPVLRQNMVAMVEERGAAIRFRTEVLQIDPDTGTVLVQKANQPKDTITADLIVVADGLHSLADKMVEALPGGSLRMRSEPLNYVTVLLDKQACEGLSLHHIHFWHQPASSAIAIGLPNQDGSIAALLISRFDDTASDASPFATEDLARHRLQADFPRLLELDPKLLAQVTGKKRGRFYYKSISHYVLGKRCVVVGDASSAAPPWAGFGANTAIYSADALARFMVGLNPHSDMDQVLRGFERHKLALAEDVLDYAAEHGQFLSSEVAQNPDQRPIGPVLGQLINDAVQRSAVPTTVQLLSF